MTHRTPQTPNEELLLDQLSAQVASWVQRKVHTPLMRTEHGGVRICEQLHQIYVTKMRLFLCAICSSLIQASHAEGSGMRDSHMRILSQLNDSYSRVTLPCTDVVFPDLCALGRAQYDKLDQFNISMPSANASKCYLWPLVSLELINEENWHAFYSENSPHLGPLYEAIQNQSDLTAMSPLQSARTLVSVSNMSIEFENANPFDTVTLLNALHLAYPMFTLPPRDLFLRLCQDYDYKTWIESQPGCAILPELLLGSVTLAHRCLGQGCSASQKMTEVFLSGNIALTDEELCGNPTTKGQTPLIIALGASLGAIALLVCGFILYRYNRSKSGYARAGSFGEAL